MQTFIAGYCEISLIKSASERRNHFEPETDGYYNRKQIRHLRTQSGMTQEELAGKLNVTRQALSNWERDVNEPDLNTLKKICFLFGVHMDDFAKEVITKMETCEKKRNDNLISMIWQLDFFMVSGYFLALVFSLLAVL